jgi:hypothetical protein
MLTRREHLAREYAAAKAAQADKFSEAAAAQDAETARIVGEYERGERRALPSVEQMLAVIRLLRRAEHRAAFFRTCCDERDAVITELLHAESQP